MIVAECHLKFFVIDRKCIVYGLSLGWTSSEKPYTWEFGTGEMGSVLVCSAVLGIPYT